MLEDGEAERIRQHAGRADAPRLREWIAELLSDRRARISLEQDLARQLHALRGRLAQAAKYLDGLLGAAYARTRAPWPKKLPCPICGAPAIQCRAEQRPEGGHELVHEHPDETICRGKPGSKAPA